MKLTWITDVHLNFLEKDKRMDFYQMLIATDSDGEMISGDIAEATSIEPILKEMVNATQKSIYFVLGNHDYGDYYPWKSSEEKEINIRRIIDFEILMGFRVLLNESASIKINGSEICILGVENWGHRMFKRYGKLEMALKGTDQQVTTENDQT